MNEQNEFTYVTSYLRWFTVAEKLGYDTVKNMLEDLYNNPERTVEQVGQLVGFTGMAVDNTMRRLGIPRREPLVGRNDGNTKK